MPPKKIQSKVKRKQNPQRKKKQSDQLAKIFLREKIAAEELLHEYLPPDLKERLNWSSLSLATESFVEEKLKNRSADILYYAQTIDHKPLALYFLIEAQTTQGKKDQDIAFRLWRYQLLIIEKHLKDGKELPIIVPIVLYHGANKYRSHHSLWELFPDPVLAKRFMGDKYQLIDLQSMSDADILRKQHLGMLEFFLKQVNNKNVDLLQIWRTALKAFDNIIKTYDANFKYIYIMRFLWYTDNYLPAEQKQELENIITETLEQGEKFMRTVADTYREEGVKQVAVEMLQEHETIEKISRFTKLSTDQILTLKNKISQ